MSGHGGARPGAGRKKRGMNRMSREMREAAAATGMLPHEILMRLGRGERVTGFKKTLSEEARIDCLKASAAFYAPKLMAAAVRQMPADWNPYAELMESVKPSRGLPFRPALSVVK